MAKVFELDEDDFARAVAQDLLWSAEHAESKKARKACRRAAVYYMTYEDTVAYFGEEKAREYWNGQ